MPLIESAYEPDHWLLRNGHVQTIYPSLYRTVEGVAYERERIDTLDGDFLDLDWSRVGAGRVAVLSHGLEGDAQRAYMRGMARALNRHGWDVLAWNYRGCSGTPNRTLRFYHSGETGDLDHVVRHAFASNGYAEAALVGFSLGGNVTLKYVGERGDALDPRIVGSVAFSVPCDLAAGARHMAGLRSTVYMRRFLRSLREKVRAKKERFPDRLSDDGYHHIKDFQGFDDRYTAPLHGFKDADDYWAQSSAKYYLGGIRVPTLLVSALDDPLLPPACYPVEAARDHAYLYLEQPRHGGHVGFMRLGSGTYWSEARAAAFLASVRNH